MSRRDERRSRSRSPGPSAPTGLHPTLTRFGVGELGDEDYYVRSSEFKAWLADTKRKYLDEISSREARRYFERFARRWNEGQLPEAYYTGTIRTSSVGSSGQTRHRWAFTRGDAYTDKEQEQLALVRDSVDTLTNSQTRGATEARNADRRTRHQATNTLDAMPPPASRDSGWTSRQGGQMEREHAADMERVARSEARRRERAQRLDEDDATHGRATGRERMLEKKRERSAAHRDFADRRAADDGIELDDRDLYDPEPASSTIPSAHRPSRGSKREQQRQEQREERKAEMDDKLAKLKAKDAQTMHMLKTLAQQRFGA